MSKHSHEAKMIRRERIRAAYTQRDAELLAIAKAELNLETLETRNMDRLDFSDQGVASIKAALEAAYEAGFKAARTGGES